MLEVVREFDAEVHGDPISRKKTVTFWTGPDPPVVTQVIEEFLKLETSESWSHAQAALDFVDCDGLMVPRTVRTVGIDQDGHWIVHEWVSEDLGTRPPTLEDFVIRVPATTRVRGLRKLPPVAQSMRTFDVGEFRPSDFGPLGTIPPPIVTGRTVWIISVVALTALLAGSSLVLGRRRRA